MILVDANALISICDRGQKNHPEFAKILGEINADLVTTLPCLTEAMYFMAKYAGWHGREILWAFISDYSVIVHHLSPADLNRIRSLMKKYSDVPMDFADASLVVAAENLGTFRIDVRHRLYCLPRKRTKALRNYSMTIKKVTQHPSQNESLIFERSQTGRVGYRLPKLDVDSVPFDEIIPAELQRNDDLDGVPEVSEVDVIRHFTRISTWNYSIDLGMYPLGSCTMKYNSRLNEKVARIPGFANLHPLAPEEESQGALELIYKLQQDLAEITGLPGVSLQPAAGAQGEMTGVMLIRAFLDKRDGEASKDRRVMLIPDNAHGTNPASAALAGFTVKTVRSTEEGLTDLEHLQLLCDEGGVAGLMITNPNTVGIFETNFPKVCEMVHDAGGLVYMDGANMNALVGVARPGDMGADVIHLNLHKTFSTPHGGGGPGCGPCCCTAELAEFLPVPRVVSEPPASAGGQVRYRLDYDAPNSIGRVKAYFGNFGMMVRALSYIYTHGAEGLREATEAAVLNARYLSHQLEGDFDKPYAADPMHEVVLSHKLQAKKGIHTLDIAKRLIDYGFHPMTVYFPLVVEGAMLIEPTESVGRQDLDAFVEAMKDINREIDEDPDLVHNAPHSTRIGRLDEAAAARKPVLRWKKDMETLSTSA